MAGEFRYPLTRYCLRSGTMTLPQAMVGLFPAGPLKALDTKSGEEVELSFAPPRTVMGLGELYRAHGLAVNDELHVRALDDGRFAITPVARPRTPDYATPEGLGQLLDELAQARLRMTVQEVRAYFEVPEEVDLAAALAADGRFALREGRWVDAETAAELDAASAAAAPAAPEETGARAAAPAVAEAEHADVAEVTEQDGLVVVGAARAEEAAAEAPEPQVPPAAARFLAPSGSGAEQGVTSLHAGTEPGGHAGRGAAPSGQAAYGAAQPGLWPQGEGQQGQQLGGLGAAHTRSRSDEGPRSVQERRAPAPVLGRPPAGGLEEEEEAALEATALADRLRRVVTPLGFSVEPIARNQVSLVASMGRRGYKVLVQLLSRAERVDWADLLSKRRTLDYRHLAVVGDHQALIRLTGPAELARATLWSWQGLERVAALHASLPLSPVDLEPHFERDGLFEQGLERFEAKVSERLAERGAFSEVLARLNLLRAPTVFLLEDLVSEVSLPRDRVLAILERLAAAPFSMLARVDTGEFVLRQPVAGALEALSAYALSLRERLPERRTERLTGHGEPLLLGDDADLEGEADEGDDDQGLGSISA